ncbi:unnamed protein product [Cylicostephanus goldi]|uniref:Uncharacterized protein n=1 Tax=Cylicostephanus goldi TaxID=71465 RepID=A0A3P7MPN8_CYLGO|nr:unnamed protein product [Cylicostephanus goldi]
MIGKHVNAIESDPAAEIVFCTDASDPVFTYIASSRHVSWHIREHWRMTGKHVTAIESDPAAGIVFCTDASDPVLTYIASIRHVSWYIQRHWRNDVSATTCPTFHVQFTFRTFAKGLFGNHTSR